MSKESNFLSQHEFEGDRAYTVNFHYLNEREQLEYKVPAQEESREFMRVQTYHA